MLRRMLQRELLLMLRSDQPTARRPMLPCDQRIARQRKRPFRLQIEQRLMPQSVLQTVPQQTLLYRRLDVQLPMLPFDQRIEPPPTSLFNQQAELPPQLLCDRQTARQPVLLYDRLRF